MFSKHGQERVREKYEWKYSFSHKFELAFNSISVFVHFLT